METTELWDTLHALPEHQLRYPSEHVVRWLAGLPNGEATLTALDIGFGSSRHLYLLEEFGYLPHGVDASTEAVMAWRSSFSRVQVADMTALPYDDETFDIALAYGVFYYGSKDDHRQAISEMHRVLKSGGYGLAVARTYRDSRTTRLDFNGHLVDGDERGMRLNFISASEIDLYYGKLFSEMEFELTETTRNGRTWRDSDWLIQVTK